MGRARVYASRAEQQAAYRQRKHQQQQQPAAPDTAPALYQHWRRSLRDIVAHLDTIREQMEDYATQRSERWQESEQASNFEADRDQLEEISDSITSLTMWRPAP